jgi:hypothetical protein
MRTEYTIFRPGHESGERHEIDWPEEPDYREIVALISSILGGADLEHVNVLYEAARHDMFIDELSSTSLKPGYPLPQNDRATEIYRANWLAHHRCADPEELPAIYGPAVLFHRIVWT